MGRYKLPLFLGEQIDLVLSQQWDNALSYFYLDVLHAGYPLVHNSPYLSDCGYYYDDADGWTAGDLVVKAFEEYRGTSSQVQPMARCLWRHHALNPANQAMWDSVLQAVMKTKLAEHRRRQLLGLPPPVRHGGLESPFDDTRGG